MNSAVNPFLMKVLLKKEVCGSHEQCMRPNKTQLTLFSKKEKEKWNAGRGTQTQYPNGY